MPFDDRTRDAFLIVASHGSIGRAAEVLNMSQPTLSRMIKRLEMRLGVPLFDRFASGVTLNVYGEALLPFANRIDLESSHARDEIERLRTGSLGVLRIGSAVSVGAHLLPPIFHRMVIENPNLRIEMLEGVQDTLEPALLNRQVDIIIATEMPVNEDMLRLDLTFSDYGSVIASPHHPVRARGPLTVADLKDELWTMPPQGSQPRRGFERILAELGISPPRIAVETWSTSMMKALVADSGFLSWLPDTVYKVEEKAGLITDLEVAGMTVPRRMVMYRRSRGLVPPVVTRFLEIARTMAN
ncbi:LysR family transcriptional regulator [Sphingobium lignivorans]|uniref:DNA-binding transcriptional LysR family regulator n=1 Tax=Sphingobium lignivorans TaxID=2735886 RepID=A0ABR6NJA9_9SPHN|nr:LysR family transcriptional regulator [Sphingobium lignivorans]MBB5986707.1 DNA-binding transcriptional LysR family regulator [Sphingobium lignivorans]